MQSQASPGEPQPELTRFDLDFPGGTPGTLVRAIEEAWTKPLNVIIPPDLAETPLPPIKVSGVSVPELFQALEQATRRVEYYFTGIQGIQGASARRGYQQRTWNHAFRTTDPSPDDASIWYFYTTKEEMPTELEPKKLRQCLPLYLGNYLDRFAVEDITTAIETAWALLGPFTDPQPRLKYHKDTDLLLAVGTSEELGLIQNVLAELNRAPKRETESPGKIERAKPAEALPKNN